MESTPTRRARRPVLAILALLAGLATTLGIGSTAHAAEGLDAASPAPSAAFQFNGIVRSDPQTPLAGVIIEAAGAGGFSATATTGADGRWVIPVSEPGTYTISIDEASLPDGLAVDPTHLSRDYDIGNSSTQAVLFRIGAPGSFGDAGGGGTGSPSSGPSSGGSQSERPFLPALMQRLITGVNLGLLLALAAIGITLIFGTTGVNNFAHGEMLTFGALAFYLFTTGMALPVVVAVPLVLIASAAFGFLHDAAVFKPLRRKRVGLVQVLIVTIGLSIALRYFYQFLFGGGSETLAVDNSARISLGDFNITVSNIISMVVSLVVLLGVAFFLTRTRIGKATRAVSDNAALAAASGINVDRVIRIVWTLAGTLTGLAGILYAYFTGASVRWDMGFLILLLLFAAVTLGGLGSAFGALVGALIIGIVTQVSTLWLPPDLRIAVALLILILVLLFRPQGVLGRKERIG